MQQTPGREGQHIFYAFWESIKNNTPVKRLWLQDLTEKTIHKALNNLIDANEDWLNNLRISSQLRGWLDWEVGMNFTRAATLVANEKINLGRVMTPTLRMIVDREKDIKNFTPQDYWEIECDFEKYKGIFFYTDSQGKDNSQILDRNEAEEIVRTLGMEGKIISVDKKEKSKRAPELYSLVKLQNEANEIYGYTMSETLEAAQSLYESGLISYPRTDSSYLTQSVAEGLIDILKVISTIDEFKLEADKVLNNESIIKSRCNDKRFVNDAKVSDHYAIIITNIMPNLSSLKQIERDIYSLICKRILSIFMDPLKTISTTIITDINGHKFKTIGTVIEDLGYKKLYDYKFKEQIIPNVSEGEIYSKKDVAILDKKTKSPKRLTDSSLNTMMEDAGRLVSDEKLSKVLKQSKGIGTPSTRHIIVEKLISLGMIERKDKLFLATDYGMTIIEQLKDFDIISVELTAVWERRLEGIESGEYCKEEFYDEMIKYIKDTTESIKEKNISVSNQSIIGVCPKCGKDVIQGKNYYHCLGYKPKEEGCNFIIGKKMWGANISKSEVVKILNGGKTRTFNFKTEKDGKAKSWSAALKYDKEQMRISFVGNESLCKCPKCEGEIIEGKNYYLCSNYKKENQNCSIIIPKEFMSVKISKNDLKSLLSGKQTSEKSFSQVKNGKTKTWDAKLSYDIANNKFEFKNNTVCKCSCGGDIIKGKNYYRCSNYKNTCQVIIPLEYSNASITEDDVKKLINKKETNEKEFIWKSGKKGKAKLKYTNRLEFVF